MINKNVQAFVSDEFSGICRFYSRLVKAGAKMGKIFGITIGGVKYLYSDPGL
jgi:hypothetical protein